MKKLTGIAICAALVLGAIVTSFHSAADARGHRQPTPPPSAATGKPLTGVNYGNHLTPNTYSATAATADFAELKADGITDIRVATQCYDNCGGWLDMTKQVALQAKASGLTVMWGVDSSNTALTQSAWQSFLNASPSVVKWCSDNKIDYCEVGNEEDDHVAKGFSPTTLRTMLKAEATTLKSLYPNQKLTYSATQSNIVNWMDAGAFDKVGFNLYSWSGSPFQTDVTKVKANPKGIVTEWNLDDGINNVNGNQTAYANGLVNDRNILEAAGLTNYFFTLRGGANGIGTNWGLWNGNTRSQAWTSLIQ